MEVNHANTIPEKVIQANLLDSYYIKIRKVLVTGSPSTEKINPCHISDLSIDDNRCFRRFNRFWIPKNLYLLVINERHDQIAAGYPSYQKKISLITQNYYWLELKKIIKRYIQNYHICRCIKVPRDRYNGLLKPLLIPVYL